MATATTVDFEGEARGYELWRHRQILPDHWELSLEASYVSDPLFLEQYFSGEAYSGKPYETSIYAKHQVDDSAVHVPGPPRPDRFPAATVATTVAGLHRRPAAGGGLLPHRHGAVGRPPDLL